MGNQSVISLLSWRLFVIAVMLILALAVAFSCAGDDDDDNDISDDDAVDDDTIMDDDVIDDDLVDDDVLDDDVLDDDTVIDDDIIDDDSIDDDTIDDDSIDDDTIDDDAIDDDIVDDDTVDDDTADDDTVSETVTVLTVNVQNPFWNLFNVDERTEIIADLILEKQPDFVALQEAAQLLFIENRAEVLAEMTGYEYVWKMTHNIPLVFQEGVAVLTQLPIEWSDSDWLPHPELIGVLRRAVLGVRVTMGLGEMYFYCSHMTISDNPEKKADQALAAWQFMKDHPTARSGFFAGDLNAEPDSLAMRFLRGETAYQGYEGDLIDSWIETNPSTPGYTYPADAPNRRIDYIYVVPGTGQLATPLECERVLTEPVGGTWATDHIGVLCRFDVP